MLLGVHFVNYMHSILRDSSFAPENVCRQIACNVCIRKPKSDGLFESSKLRLYNVICVTFSASDTY